jgi:AcrR family transcriptional regulator
VPPAARSRKKKYDPKKRPKQDRSRVTVESILEAAARILSEGGGLDRLNTNRIAERAGVAVASVYQYFPNKDSIVNALFERELAAEFAELTTRTAELEGRSLDEVIRRSVESTVAVHAKRPGLVASILESMARLGTAGPHVLARSAVIDVVARAMTERGAELRPSEHVEMKAFLVVHAVESVIHAAASERPSYLEDPAFRAELIDLVSRFLLPP